MSRRDEIPSRDAMPHLRWGIAAGAAGAAAVALLFLAIDGLAGRPLATPNALGAVLILGEPFDPTLPLSAALVLGYTAAHFGLFVGLGASTAAFVLGARRRVSTPLWCTALVGGFFLVLTALFSGFSWWLPGGAVWRDLGASQIALANLLAAGAMTATLYAGLRTAGAHRARGAAHEAARASLAARRRETSRPPIDPRALQSPPSGRAATDAR